MKDANQRAEITMDVAKELHKRITDDPTVSIPVAAIQVLLEVIKEANTSTTTAEFAELLNIARNLMIESTSHPISVTAGCDLFIRFVNISINETSFKENLLKIGANLINKALEQKERIVDNAQDFIRDGNTILIHSYSRVVMLLLLDAARKNKRFSVFVTESRPTMSGYTAAKILKENNIPTTVIVDAAVAYIIDKVDLILVGAEGIVENGGLINQIGTYQIAIIAKQARKPFYAAAESCKFVRLYPLNQYDIPNHTSTVIHAPSTPPDISGSGNINNSDFNFSDSSSIGTNNQLAKSSIDYTPPQFITLLLTDVGVLTPSGVSDELLKLHIY